MVSRPCLAGSHSLIPIPQQHRRRKYGKAPRWRWKQGDCLWVITMSKSDFIWRKLIKCITYGAAKWVGEINSKQSSPALYPFLPPWLSFIPLWNLLSPFPEWCREMGQGELWLAHNNLTLLLLFHHIIPMLQQGVPPPGTRPSQTAPRRVLPTGCSSSVLQLRSSPRGEVHQAETPSALSSTGCSLCQKTSSCVGSSSARSLLQPGLFSCCPGNTCSVMRLPKAAWTLQHLLPLLILSPQSSERCFSHFPLSCHWWAALCPSSHLPVPGLSLSPCCGCRTQLCPGVALCVWGTDSISLCSPWIHSTLSPNFQAFNRIVGCHQIIQFPGYMKNYKIILPLYFYNIGFFPCSFQHKSTSSVLHFNSKLPSSFS